MSGTGGPPREVPLVNVANALTLLRLLLVPVFLFCLMYDDGHHPGWRLVAGLVFAAASITDRFDGQLARKYGLVTPFGMVADPLADKALTGAALVGLSMLGDLSWWATALIGARELGVTALRFWVLRHGVIPASRGGKLKTLVQGLAIGLYVLPLEALSTQPEVITWTRWTALTFALLLTVGTGVDYVARALRLRSRGLSATRPAGAVASPGAGGGQASPGVAAPAAAGGAAPAAAGGAAPPTAVPPPGPAANRPVPGD